jgi:Family of unknown function (DUF5681)
MSEDGWGEKRGKPNRGLFKKGVSGNPRGRPRKVERSFTHRQMRQDFLGLMEELIPAKIGGKVRAVPAIKAVQWRMLQAALEGDRQMILEVLRLRREHITELTKENLDQLKSLERAEKNYADVGDAGFSPDAVAFLNAVRKKTRRL